MHIHLPTILIFTNWSFWFIRVYNGTSENHKFMSAGSPKKIRTPPSSPLLNGADSESKRWGDEDYLSLCSNAGWGINNCWHDEDAKVAGCGETCVTGFEQCPQLTPSVDSPQKNRFEGTKYRKNLEIEHEKMIISTCRSLKTHVSPRNWCISNAKMISTQQIINLSYLFIFFLQTSSKFILSHEKQIKPAIKIRNMSQVFWSLASPGAGKSWRRVGRFGASRWPRLPRPSHRPPRSRPPPPRRASPCRAWHLGGAEHGLRYGDLGVFCSFPKKEWTDLETSLVGGDWNHGILWISIQLGMSSSQLTNSYFSEG